MDSIRAAFHEIRRIATLPSDPVYKLFHGLPNPKYQYYAGALNPVHDEFNEVFEWFLEGVGKSKSMDPDFEFLALIVVAWDRRPVAVGFSDHLAALALKKGLAPTDKSTKAKQLRYHLWMAQGRKDETSPFDLPKPSQDSPAISHAQLPECSEEHKCKKCGKSDNVTRCTRCRIVYNDVNLYAVRYCCYDCQRADFSDHRSRCDDIARLKRATSLFRDLFYTYSQTCFTLNIKKISTNDGIVTVELDSLDSFAYQGKHVIWTFPGCLAGSKENADAVMFNESSGDVLTAAKQLFELLMRGSKYTLEKVVFTPKNAHLTVDINNNEFHSYNSLRTHEVIRVTLPSGWKAAFDPTCAKFGWREYLVPWKMYAQERIFRIYSTSPIQPDTRINKPGQYFNECSSHTYAAFLAKQSIIERAVSEVKQAAEKFGGLEHLLQSTHKIENALSEVLNAGKWGMNSRAAALRRDLRYKLFFDDKFRMFATRNSATFNMFHGVWFTRAEYDQNKGDPKLLQALWRMRMRTVLDPFSLNTFRIQNVVTCQRPSSPEPEQEPEPEPEPDSEPEQQTHPALPEGIRYGSREHALARLEGRC
ncbi:hypothetical protein F5X99DRAFT_426416 [Biscogniauxia marginata]|nr:hypothetical protein F5X99DRAFT_426416 [Biscogniauxia marginata]